MLEKKISLFTNNKGNEFLTQLEATLELSDKLDSVVEAVKSIPETVIPETLIPDYPSEMVISNLPDVQKVEITNLPQEKDDTAQLAILEKINSELKNIGQKEIDLSELQSTLDAILASSSKVEQKEVKQIDTRPELNSIQSIINTLNDNVVSIDIPELDYKRLAQIIKDNVKISVSGGGGTSMVTDRNNVQINPATSDLQQKQYNLWADSARFDAFSRLRVSEPTNLFSVSAQYGAVTVQMERGATGTGVTPVHNANTRMVELVCTAGTGTSYMQSFKYISYQPGKSHEVACTFVAGTRVAGAVFEIGYFDFYNGLFFRQTGTTISVVRRTSTSGSVVDNEVLQADWNLDKLDGTGDSGVTIDDTKAQILFIDFQYLGMGRVRMGFDIGGVIIYCHEFRNANVLDVPYMQSGTLPIQVLLTTTGTASTKTSYFKCAAVHSEGGFEEDRAYQLTTPEGTATAANGARTHLISIRPKTTYNGIINREDLVLGPLAMLVTGNHPVFWELLVGATFSVEPTWADINTASSAFQYGVGGTFSGLATGAIVIQSGYIGASNQVKEAISAQVTSKTACSLNRAGAVRAAGVYTLVVTGIGGASNTRGACNFKEIR